MSARIHVLPLGLLFVVALVMAASAYGQTTWYVDDDGPGDPGPGDPTVSDPAEDGSAAHPFDAIQEGIDAAIAGDTVLVLDGTYTGAGNKGLDFGGKDIIVRSENGPAGCIIDCQDDGRGFYLHGGETNAAIVDGLTITDGYLHDNDPAPIGAGIRCEGSSPTIRNCWVTDNRIWHAGCVRGGGIYCAGGGTPLVVGCVIAGNGCGTFGIYARGGGLYCGSDTSLTVVNCLIEDNGASGATTLDTAFAEGGGVFCQSGSDAILTNCTIVANRAHDFWYSGSAGGIYGDASITNCVFWDNEADLGDTEAQQVAGVGAGQINHSCVEGWTGGLGGTGNIGSDPTFAGPDNGDYHLSAGSPCIDAGDNTAVPPDEADIDNDGDIHERTPLDLDGLPRFVDDPGTVDTGVADLPDYPYVVDMGVYEVDPTVPIICVMPAEFTFAAAVGGPNPDDQSLSIWNCGFATLDWEVVEDCAWLSAVPTSGQSEGEIDEVALSVDVTGLSVGEYTCDIEVVDPAATNNSATIEVTLQVSAPRICVSPPLSLEFVVPVGGPEPEDQTLSIWNCSLGVLNWEVVEDCPWLSAVPLSGQSSGEVDDVTLSVDVGGLSPGEYVCDFEVVDPAASNSPKAVQVTLYVGGTLHVPSEYLRIQSALDAAVPGDIILVADGTYTGIGNRDLDFAGKPIAVKSQNGPSACTIDCQGAARGFVFNDGETPDAVVDGFTITNGNASGQYGGAIKCRGSSPTIRNCIFSGSTADGGGGVYADDCGAALTNCIVAGNTAERGGGLYVEECSLTLTNCLITGNNASFLGGGVYSEVATLTLVSCTVSGNNAAGGGGGANVGGGSDVAFANCVSWGNTSPEGAQLRVMGPVNPSTVAVSHSDVQGGQAAVHVAAACTLNWGDGNIDADPLFVDAAGGDYHLGAGSPCIDAADTTAVPADSADVDNDRDTTERTPLDLDALPRFVNDPGTGDTGVADPPDYPQVVDMGAYEYGIPCDLDGDCDVDLGDLAQLLSNYGETSGMGYEDGDVDGDGDVELPDLAALLAVYNTACP